MSERPEIIEVRSKARTLRGFVWRPDGNGPFPAALFNHGSYHRDDPMPPEEPAAIGPVFVRHGYLLLFLCRPGVYLSAGEGIAGGEQMSQARIGSGQEGRNRVQMELLEGEEMNAALAGLAWLCARPEVDRNRIAVAGHSFGGSLTLLLAAREPSLRAAVIFGGAAGSWEHSLELRERLLEAARQITMPVLFIHAANDYSTAPGLALTAERERLGRLFLLKIYPASGRSSREGHNLVYRHVEAWEQDIFAFLESPLEISTDANRPGFS